MKVAVFDSGIDISHEDLASKFDNNVPGINYVNWEDDEYKNDETYLTDENGHGTHIAGIIAGERTGIASGVQLFAVKVLDKKGYCEVPVVLVKAIDWCINHQVDIINLSLGRKEPFPERIKNAFQKASEANIILIASAGNYHSGALFPASYNRVLSVGGIDNDTTHSDFSNIWSTIDFSAPAEKIFSTYISGKDTKGNDVFGYEIYTGTSQAAPIATGILSLGFSLLKENGVNYNPKDVLSILFESLSKKKNLARYNRAELEEIARRYGLDNSKLSLSEIGRWVYGRGIISANRFIKKLIKTYDMGCKNLNSYKSIEGV